MLRIARREIVERRLYLLGGLLAGFLPLLAPLLPLASSQPAAEVRETAAMMLFGLASAACLKPAGRLSPSPMPIP